MTSNNSGSNDWKCWSEQQTQFNKFQHQATSCVIWYDLIENSLTDLPNSHLQLKPSCYWVNQILTRSLFAWDWPQIPCSSPRSETTVLRASAQYVRLWFVYKNLLGNEVTINIAWWKIYSVIYAGLRTGLCPTTEIRISCNLCHKELNFRISSQHPLRWDGPYKYIFSERYDEDFYHLYF